MEEAEAKAEERRSRRLSKILKQVGRTVRLDVRIRRLSKILKQVGRTVRLDVRIRRLSKILKAS